MVPNNSKNPYDQYVNNAINSQGNVTNVGESSDKVHHRGEAPLLHEQPKATAEIARDHKPPPSPQFEWSKTDEMSPSEDSKTSHVLDQIGRMDAWMTSVADKVDNVKSSVDVIREETGFVNLKDS